jgi:dihydroflavonol-4-reductase
MKYLVTGSTGLLGNNVVRALRATGNEVRVLVRAGSDPRPLEGLAVERILGDVRDPAALTAACQQVDGVIHCAGHVHVGWTQADLHRCINVDGTRNVAAAARAAGARLVHVSSTNALGLGNFQQPADEEAGSPGMPELPYVLSKREAERVVLQEVERGLWAAIVNPTTMFGPWDWKPSSGQMILEVSRFAAFAPTGAQNFGDARDVAAGAIAAVRRGQSGRRYILGGHNLTYFDAWRQIAALAGKRGPWIPMGPVFRVIGGAYCNAVTRLTGRERAGNSAALVMSRLTHCYSSARAQRELGYTIRPFEETLRDAWSWFVEHNYAAPTFIEAQQKRAS